MQSFKTYQRNQRSRHLVVPAIVAVAIGAFGITQLFTSNAAAPGDPDVPAAKLNLTNWKLTLPTGSKNKPDEVKQPALASYKSTLFLLNNDKTGVIFRTNNGGVTTSGSSNPRTELREMTNGGTTEASWSSNKGTHTMYIRQRVNRLTTYRPYVVIGQIHDADDDVTTWRLEGSNLWISVGDNAHGILVTNSYKLGTIFTVKFVVSGSYITYYYNDKQVAKIKNTFSGGYFKAGNYLQSNAKSAPKENAMSYSEVEILDLQVSHT